jgi:hypothetical protein
MSDISEAFVAYRNAEYDRALEIVVGLLRDDSANGEALLYEGLIHRRRGEIRRAVKSFQQCVTQESVDWLARRLREDHQWRPIADVTLEDGLAIGNLLRAKFSLIRPALPETHHKAGGQCLNVVGTSFVRSFGGNTCFFPLFIGMGPTTNVLTEESFAIARRKYAENVRRLDVRRDTMVVIGTEMYYHILNQLGTRPHGSPHITDDDRKLVITVSERYRELLLDLKSIVRGKLMLLGQTPAYDDMMNELFLDLNSRLADICEEIGVLYLDWWNDLADPESNCLRQDLSANAYPQDIHFALTTTGLFITKLREQGVLDDRVSPGQNYEWSHMFECEIEPSEKTRIWPEPSVSPNNAFRSDKIAASYAEGRLADLTAALLNQQADPFVLIVNCRDAWLPVNIPPQLVSVTVAVTDSADNRDLGQMVIDFYGRSDVVLLMHEYETLQRLQGIAFTYVILCLYPDSYSADLERARQTVRRLARPHALLVITPFPDRLNDLSGLGFGRVVMEKVGNRHLPELWRETTLAMLT